MPYISYKVSMYNTKEILTDPPLKGYYYSSPPNFDELKAVVKQMVKGSTDAVPSSFILEASVEGPLLDSIFAKSASIMLSGLRYEIY